jgi:hypothetical protein
MHDDPFRSVIDGVEIVNHFIAKFLLKLDLPRRGGAHKQPAFPSSIDDVISTWREKQVASLAILLVAEIADTLAALRIDDGDLSGSAFHGQTSSVRRESRVAEIWHRIGAP